MQEKNIGIEALRVVAMLMIISLHYLGHGGLIHTADASNNQLGWLLESFSYVAVNCYVLISGFLLINSNKFKLKRVIELWAQIMFYVLGFAVIFYFLQGSIPSIKTFFPITTITYWFATAYMGLYLFSPYLNKMLWVLDKKEFNRLIAIIVILFSFMSFLSFDTFQIRGGYSLIWLVSLYIIGAYIRLFDVSFNKIALLGIYAGMSFITFYSRGVFVDLFYNYNSITVLAASVSLFLFFKDLKFAPIINKFGSLTFGVYLIHENPSVREWLWEKVGATGPFYNSPDFTKHYLVSVFGIFIVCAAIEWCRQWIFRVVRGK